MTVMKRAKRRAVLIIVHDNESEQRKKLFELAAELQLQTESMLSKRQSAKLF